MKKYSSIEIDLTNILYYFLKVLLIFQKDLETKNNVWHYSAPIKSLFLETVQMSFSKNVKVRQTVIYHCFLSLHVMSKL